MLISASTMRALMVVCLLGMAVIALLSLRRRGLSKIEFIGWGLLALGIPLVGPFLVIAGRPGKRISS